MSYTLSGHAPGSRPWLEENKQPWRKRKGKVVASYIKHVGSCQYIYVDDATVTKSEAQQDKIILVEGV